MSFLERLMSPQFPCYNRQPGSEPGEVGSYDAKMVTKLLNNYRSHPAIIKVLNLGLSHPCGVCQILILGQVYPITVR